MKRAEDIFRAAVQPALLLLCIGVFCGCSVLGFATGALIDGREPDNIALRTGDAERLGSGDHVRFTLVDSSVVEGIFKEFAPLDSLAYALNYERFLQHADPSVTFPRLGDTLEFTTHAGIFQQWNYVFRGYGLGTLEVQRIHQFHINDILLRHLSTLENRAGVKFDVVVLERMSDAGQLPRALTVVVHRKL
ncbi:MAG TPA: hypothetical protein VI758_08755, partial [Bacteroidota bacterium]